MEITPALGPTPQQMCPQALGGKLPLKPWEAELPLKPVPQLIKKHDK